MSVDSRYICAQAIQAGDLQLLEICRLDEGDLTPAFLAIAYDRPEVLTFLHRAGVDLSLPCDDYATPAFYAAYRGQVKCLEQLARLGVDLRQPCTKFGDQPSVFFPPEFHDQLVHVLTLRDRAATAIARVVRGKRHRAVYDAKRRALVIIQRRFRDRCNT